MVDMAEDDPPFFSTINLMDCEGTKFGRALQSLDSYGFLFLPLQEEKEYAVEKKEREPVAVQAESFLDYDKKLGSGQSR
ncbi:hypothetical protein F0562_013696 [Nyssa sinensis]|uniref:Uncharacterized protein n=1 Tax=Nyssa sinensis TaxID=561372 RepID=A0A5J4ZN83_9ASTE|nr:hypothetical protein F0562_013696 [Nyssa sinensis]